MGCGSVDDVLPDQARADSGQCGFGVDDALREPAGVDEENVTAERDRAVAGALNTDAQTQLRRESHSCGNVLRALDCHHSARRDGNRCIPRNRQLVSRFARQGNGAGHLCAQ